MKSTGMLGGLQYIFCMQHASPLSWTGSHDAIPDKYIDLFLSLILSFRFSTSSAFRISLKYLRWDRCKYQLGSNNPTAVLNYEAVTCIFSVFSNSSNVQMKFKHCYQNYYFTQLMEHRPILRNYSSSCPKMLQYLTQVHISVKYKLNLGGGITTADTI